MFCFAIINKIESEQVGDKIEVVHYTFSSELD
jgi:hypothetical protein